MVRELPDLLGLAATQLKTFQQTVLLQLRQTFQQLEVSANGEQLAAIHRSGADVGSAMAIRTISGRSGLDALVANDLMRKVRLTDPGALRFTLIASDFDAAQLASRVHRQLPLRCFLP